jgi:ABC-2 type transport system ATP-binding protein
MIVLEVSHLSKSYGAVTGVCDVSFSVHAGEIVGLLGPNGSGKSTTLHCLTGILAPTRGSVRIAGEPLSQRRAKSRFGFVPDDLPTPDLLTGREYLELIASLQLAPVDARAVAALVSAVRLDHALDRTLGAYSHGMRRKIQLVAALMHEPELLILDEPFRGLDPESSALLKAVLRAWRRRGGACLISTHDLLVAEQMCDRAVVLSEGDLLAVAEIEALCAETGADSLEAAFALLTGIEDGARSAEAAVESMLSGAPR